VDGDGMDGWDVSIEPREMMEMGIGCAFFFEFIRNYGENE